MSYQDTKTTVLRKNGPKGASKLSAHELAKQKAAGGVGTEKRYGGAGNAQSGAAVYARKLDEAEIPELPKVSHSFKVALQKARVAKKMSQKDLAVKLNVKPSVIQDYESGKVVPDGALVSRMQRILGPLPKIKKVKKKKGGDDE